MRSTEADPPESILRTLASAGAAPHQAPMYAIFNGRVQSGFQFASGAAVGRTENGSPYSRSTLELQAPLFKARGFDLEEAVPNLFRGSINVNVGRELVIENSDVTLPLVDWTRDEATRIAPETFSFVRCCLAIGGRYHIGLIYYPHPETKPSINVHRYDVLEVLTERVDGLAMGDPAAIFCRADAFRAR